MVGEFNKRNESAAVYKEILEWSSLIRVAEGVGHSSVKKGDPCLFVSWKKVTGWFQELLSPAIYPYVSPHAMCPVKLKSFAIALTLPSGIF